MTKKTPEVSVTWKIKFTKEEMNLIRVVLMFATWVVNEQWMMDPYTPEKDDELTSMLTFKETKKCIKDWKVIAGELELWTEQKALIIKRFDTMKLAVWELETKFELLEKLK